MRRTGIILILLLTCLQVGFAQSATKAQKKAEQKKEQQARIAKKAEEKGRKRHEAIQTKDVRKKMKRNKKRYNHVDSYDRRPNFIQRIFKRKRASAY